MMAFVKETIASRLVLVLETGLDDEDKPIYRTSSFSRVSPLAIDENVHAVALTLAGLQEHSLVTVRRVDDHDLRDE